MSNNKTITIVLISTCKPVLADNGMKTKFETFIEMAISLLSPLWCSFVKEAVVCVSRSFTVCNSAALILEGCYLLCHIYSH